MGFPRSIFYLFFMVLPFVAQADGLAVSCIDAAGASTSTSSCKSILPKCADLKTSYEATVKRNLSWKIWGYYNGKNIDLDNSNLNSAAPTLNGVDLMYPICSVVGHKMQYAGASPLATTYDACNKTRKPALDAYTALGFELANQTIGKKGTCGVRPDTDSGSNTLTLKFANGAGNLWNSYLVGAYPWLIRRQAYEVLSALKPDLSNLGDLITDTSVKADVTALNTKMAGYYNDLSTTSKAVCAQPVSDVAQKCIGQDMVVTDPSNRICTLVKAQLLLNTGGVPNILVKEIMKRVQTQYDDLFGKLITFKVPASENLWNKCKDTGGLFTSVKTKNSRTASCLFDGADFYTYSNNLTTENACTGSHHGAYPVGIHISDGKAQDVKPKTMGADMSLSLGFAGVVESIIRRDICKQNTWSDVSICDTVNIPDKPDGVQ